MANVEQALLAFAKLISLLDDSSGAVRWEWFAKPGDETLDNVPAKRRFVGEVLRALLDPNDVGPAKASSLAGFDWEPFQISNGIGVGFAWNNTDTDANVLNLGLAADAKFTDTVTLAVLARLFHVANKSIGSDLGAAGASPTESDKPAHSVAEFLVGQRPAVRQLRKA